MSDSILDIKQSILFDEYLNQLKTMGVKDIDKIADTALHSIKYYSGSKYTRDKLKDMQRLENKWYASLKKGKADYSIYSDNFYISDLWACWFVYSRKYLRSLRHPKSLVNKSIIKDMRGVKTVVDLGCGIGYTTAGLQSLFPKADVIGTNIKDTFQTRFAVRTGKRYNFKIKTSLKGIKKADVIFASEYFEHFQEPIGHLKEVLKLNPRYLIIANAFGTVSMGHFIEYIDDDGNLVDGKKISRIFSSVLKDNGYTKVKTKLWNNRPAYWKK